MIQPTVRACLPFVLGRILAFVPPFALVPLGGCGQGESSAAVAADDSPFANWSLSAVPAVSIGIAEGDPRYLLHEVAGVVRLPNGNVAVLSAGSREIRFYDAAGSHLRTTGDTGGGPGEFRNPVRLYLTHPDSLHVFDATTGLESRFDTAGAFVRSEPWKPPADETFGRDAWLHGRTLVDGPPDLAIRKPARRLLDRLPFTDADAPFRLARIDDHGRVWIRPEPHDPESPATWRIYSLSGRPLAQVTTPARFEIQHIGEDYLGGRAWDDLGVQSAVIHELPDATVPGSTVGEPGETGPPPTPAISPQTLQHLRSLLRNVAAQQEMFYSKPENGYRYAWRADQLDWPDDMQAFSVHIVAAGPRGYTLFIVHETDNVSCGMTVGFGGPVGWTPGRALCGA